MESCECVAAAGPGDADSDADDRAEEAGCAERRAWASEAELARTRGSELSESSASALVREQPLTPGASSMPLVDADHADW